MKVLFVAAEATPLVKVGGLADVIGSLPKALIDNGHDVRVMMPRYGVISTDDFLVLSAIDNLSVDIMGSTSRVSLKMTVLDNKVKVYLVDSDEFQNSTEIYGKDELRRFLLFCRAVLNILSELDWQPDIVHCHDWHTGLIPLWLKKNNCPYASVFTIHNLAYQGFFDDNFLFMADLDRDWKLRTTDAPTPPLNFMSQGILWADMVTTVSETYAREILTPEYGVGLDYILRYRQNSLFGIVNGLDYDSFNPATDNLIPTNYDFSMISKRTENKLALQKRVRFTANIAVPLVGMVSRLDEQKGFDILTASFDALFLNTEVQMVILGKGREEYHNLLRQAASRYPQRLAVDIEFNDALAHLIYAGCDMFLMPSRFEPCGLGQLIAMRYGAVPIVHQTGGLADTVKNLNENLDNGNGFVFKDYNTEAMLNMIQQAVNGYKKKAWHDVLRRIMALDFSWHASAKKYEALYNKVLEFRKS